MKIDQSLQIAGITLLRSLLDSSQNREDQMRALSEWHATAEKTPDLDS